eukprot:2866020-Prymnesium_polylepis.1
MVGWGFGGNQTSPAHCRMTLCRTITPRGSPSRHNSQLAHESTVKLSHSSSHGANRHACHVEKQSPGATARYSSYSSTAKLQQSYSSYSRASSTAASVKHLRLYIYPSRSSVHVYRSHPQHTQHINDPSLTGDPWRIGDRRGSGTSDFRCGSGTSDFRRGSGTSDDRKAPLQLNYPPESGYK